jgi:hypothetical protein
MPTIELRTPTMMTRNQRILFVLSIVLATVFSFFVIAVLATSAQALTPEEEAVYTPNRVAITSDRTTPAAGRLHFVRYELRDPKSHLRVATVFAPAGWTVFADYQWLDSADRLLTGSVHIESPDHSLWVDLLPWDGVMWTDRKSTSYQVGRRYAGWSYLDREPTLDALRSMVGRVATTHSSPTATIEARRIDALAYAAAFDQQEKSADADAFMATASFMRDDRPAKQVLFVMAAQPQATLLESADGKLAAHYRPIGLIHAFGATEDRLTSVTALLATIASSFRPDADWDQLVPAILERLQLELRMSSAPDVEPQAARSERLMRELHSMKQFDEDVARVRERQSRAVPVSGPADGFVSMVRPYWPDPSLGSDRYQWTDAAGNYRASGDIDFDPNRVAGPHGWKLLTSRQ